MSEYNTCGVLVTTRPELGSVIERILRAVEGMEVHARDAGRIVATVKGMGRYCVDTISDLSAINGVISTSRFNYYEADPKSQ